MQAVLNIVLPVFGIILCGYFAGRAKLLGASSSEAINAFVYWFALPPLIFIGMAETPVVRILNIEFIVTVSLAIIVTDLIAASGSRYIFRNCGAINALHAMTALFSNTGYVGIPLFIAALPTGALVFVTAQQNKVFVQRTSACIVMTTIPSVVTLSAILGWFGKV